MPPQTAAHPGELIPAIGYIRVSWLQEEQISPEIQRNAITDWARRNGRRIIAWIEDLDVSGRTFHRRIMEGIQAVEAREAKEIVVWKFSRFGRNRTGCAVNLGRINRAGGELQSATEEVDARTAVGKLTRGMLMEIAAFESDRTGEQWAEAHANRRSRGLPTHGNPNFGYIRRGRTPDPLHPTRTFRTPEDGEERYEIDPTTGPILAELYRRYTSGQGGRTLSAWLNELGVTTTRGRQWETSVMLRMLDRGFGAGFIKIHDPNCDCGKAKTCRNVVYLDGSQPAAITQEEWNAYLRRRARVKVTAPRARVSPYPLSGRIRCGHCDAAMTIVMERSVPGVRYMCNTYLRKSLCAARSVIRVRVEAAILSGLAAWATDIQASELSNPVQPLTVQVDTASLQEEIDTLDAALDRSTRQLALGLIPEDSYKRTRDDLLADLAKAKLRLEEATRPVGRSQEDYLPVIRTLLDEWQTLEAADRREMVAELIDVVRVFRSDPRTAWVEVVSVWGKTRSIDL